MYISKDMLIKREIRFCNGNEKCHRCLKRVCPLQIYHQDVKIFIFLSFSSQQALYCDVRQFVNYVYENDGNTFRKVALSALLDSVSPKI